MLTPKSYTDKNKSDLTSKQINALLDFSLAEYGSGVEMAQAAKLVNDINLASGFLRHAFDEYRHMGVFRQIAQSVAHRKNITNLTPYISRNVFDKRYIDPQSFLFEKMSFDHFVVFILTNERYASNILINIITKQNILNKDETSQLENIMKDEERHVGFAGAFVKSFQNTHPIKARVLYVWERFDLMRRNIQSRSQGVYNFFSKMIISISLWIFIILVRFIGNDLSNDTNLESAITNAKRMS